MTQHVSEEQLILHYYGEPAGAEVDNHLAVCFECRDQYRRLQQVLNVVDIPVPERDAGYEDRLWNQVAPKLGFRHRISWWALRKWAAVAAMAGLVVAAFVAGRYSPRTEVPQTAAVQPQPQEPVRERVLVVALGDHLERSQMMLIELKNSPDKGRIDIASEQEAAQDLLSANRLYRQTAAAAGELGLVTLLEDLERVLADVAHSPETMTAADLQELRERIEAQGLLFKIRVVGSNLNERVAPPVVTEGSKEL